MHTDRTTLSGTWSRWTCLVLLGIAANTASAAVEISVIDNDRHAVAGVAVYALPATGSAPQGKRQLATMAQADSAFVPHLLIVQAGSEVAFPNNDTVSHHVYSFSPAKSFELQLYKGNQYAPLRFDTPGAVVLGCNIHDGMLGYILVVDTPYFALSDSRGTVRLDAMPDGEYTVHVWTPRARPDALPQGLRLTVRDATAPPLTVELQGQLMPAHENHGGGSLTWERY